MGVKVGVGLATISGLFLTLFSISLSQEKGEPTAFSHRFHLKEVEAECIACHISILDRPVSPEKHTLPGMADCAQCHDVEDEEGCSTCHLHPDMVEPFPVPESIVRFPHRSHIEERGLGCQDCHTGLEEVDYAGVENLPKMEVCKKCHDGTTAPEECELCHRDLVTLRPRSHKEDWLHEHNEHVRSGDISCSLCHTESYCQECHEGANLVEAGTIPQDYYAPFAPQSRGRENMVLKRVHDLNYRYTHALDSKGKERKCVTCHETATFCRECHRPEGDVNKFKPRWHGGPDWGAIAGGVGTGGGRHAELARRDIERCAACHDTQGDDPVCILCHMDRAPGLGNDPKTHKVGFADDMGDGPWHEDEGFICFNCHTNTRTAGVGFCGYCHGPRE